MQPRKGTPAICTVNQHLPALDGLRGLAILLVMMHHFALFGGMDGGVFADKAFYAVAISGWCGVDLFFVLSGFLISAILLDTKFSPHYFRNFYMRVLRIFPLYYLSLTVFFIVLPRFASLHGLAAPIENQGWYWTYLINWKIGLEDWPANYIISHFWTLAIEEQFYLFWPLLVFHLRARHLAMLCVAIILCSAVIRLGLRWNDMITGAYVLTPARMDSLAVGAFVAVMIRHPEGLSMLRRFAVPAAVLLAVGVATLFALSGTLDSEDRLMQIAGYPVLAFLSAALLVIGVADPQAFMTRAALSHPLLRLFGRVSYGLYVVHHPVAIMLQRSGLQARSFPTLFGSQLPGQVLYTLVAGVISLAMAWTLWRFYETQFLKLKRLFAYQGKDQTG